jgi:alkaline phosphatase D
MKPCTALGLIVLAAFAPSAALADDLHFSFGKCNDRIWIGPDFWANPMEDWRIKDGRLECVNGGVDRNVHVLTAGPAAKPADFSLRLRFGLLEAGPGSVGFRVGIQDEIDDYRARLIYGAGLDIGLTTDGVLFIGDKKSKLVAPVDLAKDSHELVLNASLKGGTYRGGCGVC